MYILMALCGVVLGYLTMHPSLASFTRLMTTKMCSGIYKMSIFPKGTCQLTSILVTMVNKDHVCHRMYLTVYFANFRIFQSYGLSRNAILKN